MFAAVFSAESSVNGIEVIVPPLYEIFYAALAALIIAVAVGIFGLPKIYAKLDERAADIEDGLQAAQKAREDRAAAEREREALLRQAQVEAHEIRDRAADEAKRIIAQAREDAQSEATRITELAERQIEAERQAAEISLRSDVGMLATELAEKIVGEHLKNTRLTARVVNRFLDDLEKETTSA
ncbi:MAG: ATP synthase F0 subunit B [Actinobacteria bacterium]|nr:MAG: ATP synthase F0 subunit B [Actinomycetota bacterium]